MTPPRLPLLPVLRRLPPRLRPQQDPKKSTSTYYANCTEAKAAGAAPLYRGEPGYRDKLDRDHDGIACEK